MVQRIALAFFLGCAAVAAQTITVQGIVQPLASPTVCMQGETHFLDCTNVVLRSNTIDLDLYVGQPVRATGADVGVTCHVIDVTAVAPATVVLSTAGSPALGGSVTFALCMYTSIPGDLYGVFFSASAGFFPIDPILGTVLLDPPFFPLDTGTQLTCANVPVAIPVLPALVGLSFWIQGIAVGTIVNQLSNAVCLTVI